MERKFIKINEVLQILPMGKTKFYGLVKKRILPQPKKIGGSSFWIENQIQEYLNNL